MAERGVLQAQRVALEAQRRDRVVSDEVFEKLVAEVDEELSAS